MTYVLCITADPMQQWVSMDTDPAKARAKADDMQARGAYPKPLYRIVITPHSRQRSLRRVGT